PVRPGVGVGLGGRVLIIGRETIHSDSATFIPQKPNTYAGRRRTDEERSRRGLRRIAAGAIAGVGGQRSARHSPVGATQGMVFPQAETGGRPRAAADRAPPTRPAR